MNLLKVFGKISGLTLVSRILGFVRDAIIARIFGASVATDAFFVAFKLPNLLRRIFAEGAFTQAFTPILSEYKTQKSFEETVDFTRYVAGLLSFILFWVTLLGMVAAPVVVLISAPGFSQDIDKFLLTIDLLKIVFPYIFLISLSSFIGSILNTYQRFTLPALVPVLLNIAMIIGAVFWAPYCEPPIKALAFAVLLGGILQIACQLPALKRLGFLRLPRLTFHHAGVRRVLKNMLPVILGVSVAQVSLLINTIFASFLTAGSVTWIYYADRLMELPAGLLGAALGTLLLPTLSQAASRHEETEFSDLLAWGLRLMMLLALPAAVGLALVSYPLIATLFMYREFTLNDALMTQQALIAYTVGLFALIAIKILAAGFYARQDTKTPVRIAIATLLLTQMMNLLLIGPLKHAGLALAIALGACFNAFMLYAILRRRGIYVPKNTQNGIFLRRVIIAVAVMAVFLWFALQQQSFYQFNWQVAGIWRLVQLMILIVPAASVYFIVLFLLGFRLNDIRRNIH